MRSEPASLKPCMVCELLDGQPGGNGPYQVCEAHRPLLDEAVSRSVEGMFAAFEALPAAVRAELAPAKYRNHGQDGFRAWLRDVEAAGMAARLEANLGIWAGD